MAIYKIGRAEGNHIILGDKSVSRSHAELEELGAGRFRLKDLGSTSGTQMLSGAEWVDASEAEVGRDTRLRFGEYETTPADLLRRREEAATQAPPAPKPVSSGAGATNAAAPPRPAPAAPRPADAPHQRPPVAQPARAGSGGSSKMVWWLVGGGVAFVALAAVAVVLVVMSAGGPGTSSAQERRYIAACLKHPQATAAVCNCGARAIREEFSGKLRESVFGYWADATEKGPDHALVKGLLERIAEREGDEFKRKFARSALKSMKCSQQ